MRAANQTILTRAAVAAVAFLTAGIPAWAANKTAETPPAKPILTINRAMLLADYGRGKVCRIDKSGKITWEMPAPGAQDVWMLPDGNVLYTHKRGVRIASPEKKVVWEYNTAKGNEIHTCQPLEDGKILIAESGPMRIIEVDREGKITKEVKLTTKCKRTHGQMRNVRKLANGNYLVGQYSDGVLREYDPTGKIVRDIPQKMAFGGIRLTNGNTIVATGDSHQIVEVDPAGKVVWRITENELPGNPLRFVAGMRMLPNGNLIVANWGGHGHIGKQPQVFEVTHDEQKKVVGVIHDDKQFRTISGMFVLEDEGKAGNADQAGQAVRQESLVYKKTPQGELSIHLSYPPGWKASDSRPAIVFFFGGGWNSGTVKQFASQADYLAGRGMVAARADYRVWSRQKVRPDKCVEDARSAVRWMRANAAKLGVDPNKLCASGGSAGGHLAIAAAIAKGVDADTDDKSIPAEPNLLVLYNPVMDTTIYRGRIATDEMARRLSPMHNITKDLPPAILYYGSADGFFKPVKPLSASAAKLGLDLAVFLAADQKHGFFNRPPWLERTTYLTDKFLARHGYLTGEPTVKLPEGKLEMKKAPPQAPAK